MRNHFIAPSLLSANFACLGQEARDVVQAGGDRLHLDVMDNHYVPNLTVGPLVCQSLRDFGITAPIDVHLMTKPIDSLIVGFAKAGASSITFHPDATDDIERSLALIDTQQCDVGIAINPETSLDCLDTLWTKIDLILIMSVHPGFGGQEFIPDSLKKISLARQLIEQRNPNIRLAVDGGIKVDNIAQVAAAGADTFVAGSAIFHSKDYAAVIKKMREKL